MGAYRFVDFLEASGQQLWQLLPLGPPAYGNSPYSCYSAFAGNPLLISPEQLVQHGYLPESAASGFPQEPPADPTFADHAAASQAKQPLLAASFQHFQSCAAPEQIAALQAFQDANQVWLDDFTLFQALANREGTLDWTQWPEHLATRNEDAIQGARAELDEEIQRISYLQFLFHEQWSQLKSYANEKHIRMFGDMPIFVAHSSADVWANQHLFWLDASGKPSVVAGVPPDYFSATGQRWGNPLYNWNALAKTGFQWWIERFQSAFNTLDLIRIDHFRGFQAYWEIPASAPTAVDGKWVQGPGKSVFLAAERALGELPIVAEDLGMITDEVHQLRDALQFPGMRVLQFGYDNEQDLYHRPESYPKHSVAYTGTHDNDTVMSWYAGRHHLPASDANEQPSTRPATLPVVDIPEGMHWVLIGMVLDSAADTAIIPFQDVLGLGNEARMNTPGEPDGNWTWRCTFDNFDPDTAQRLGEVTENAARRNPVPAKVG